MLKRIFCKTMRATNRWLFSFSGKKPQLTDFPDQAFEDSVNNHGEQDGITGFDFLKSADEIHKLFESQVDLARIKEAKELFAKVDQQSHQVLRLQAEKLIIKISQGKFVYKQFQKLMSLTISMQFRFRKWDDMVLNINNFIQAVKYEKGETQEATKFTIHSYNQLCAIFILNDHDQLYTLMDFEWKPVSQRRKKIQKKDTIETFGFGFPQYHKILIDFVNKQAEVEQASKVLLMQAMGLLVLGLKQQALKRLALLTGKHISQQIREEAFLAIVTSMCFKATDAGPLSQKQRDNIKNATQLNVYDAQELANSYITVEECETVFKALLRHFHKKSIKTINANLLNKYWQIIALICENYYLEGKEDDYLRFADLFKDKNHEHLNFMLRYFELARLLDKEDLEKAQALFKQIKDHDEQSQSELRPFFRQDRIIFDLLRINILKIGATLYELKEDKENAEQYQNQAELLEARLGLYTIRQPPEELLQDNELTTDWRVKMSGRVPYYYLNLKLEKLFEIQQNAFGQDQF